MTRPSLNGDFRHYLDQGDFGALFRLLGWDNPPDDSRQVELESDEEEPTEILFACGEAELRGVMVWAVQCAQIPIRARQRRITRQLRQRASDQLLIFDTGAEQLWLWPEQRPSGSGWRLVDHHYRRGSTNDALLQRLEGIRFDLKDHQSLTGPQVLERVRRSFNVDRVTKRFYQEFQKYHRSLTERIKGIPDQQDRDRRWYASILLNRLMFIYFIQRKGFMNGDLHYLGTGLQRVREAFGPDEFYAFFREYLLPLFHEGLGAPLAVRNWSDPRIAEIIGEVPYVDGGIFEEHHLESTYDIQICDSVFEEIFRFFDDWRWHLDERPSGRDNEINPDILGFIFEQYINFTEKGQKEKGAYYTKPDVTGYMTTYTIIPAVVDRMVEAGLEDPCILLPGSGDQYLHDSLGYGIDRDLPEGDLPPSAYPDEGLDLALPGERWCDVTHRRERYHKLVAEVDGGGVTTIDEAVTANLDLVGLMEDYFSQMRSDECSVAFEVLRDLKVCDPTCGSGAFLLSALDVLEPMYTALYERAEEISEREREREFGPPAFLDEAQEHPNQRYWLLKTLCLNNLYGLDLMGEAVEIARLRLFLKLVAQLEDVSQIEPLPDLDFNIKTGNLLVGIADMEDARRRFESSLLAHEGLLAAEQAANQAAADYEIFAQAQISQTGAEKVAGKQRLVAQIKAATYQADAALHKMRTETQPFDDWKKSHSPFHWFAEFPSVWQQGGFDVVVGNPPYINKGNVTEYRWMGYQTEKCPNIYALCVERASNLLNPQGRMAMIVMHNLCFSTRYLTARHYLENRFPALWISSYARGPDSLFAGSAKVRNTILLSAGNSSIGLHTTRLMRWNKQGFTRLFDSLEYTKPSISLFYSCNSYQWPFIDSALSDVFDRLVREAEPIRSSIISRSEFQLVFRKVGYFMLGVYETPPPVLDQSGNPIAPNLGCFYFSQPTHRDIALMVLAGRWAYLWWLIYGDEFNVTPTVLAAVPCDIERLATSPPSDMELVSLVNRILELAELLKTEMPNHLIWQLNAGQRVGIYNMRPLRYITDEADWLLAQAWGLTREEYEAAGNLRDRMTFGNRG